ncbi:hypothetical protein FRC07_007689 [Ceratobasidium sp. 392]|nr:hypothetical protein FRC07_007689 [Ceratobasidium sp. 392]
MASSFRFRYFEVQGSEAEREFLTKALEQLSLLTGDSPSKQDAERDGGESPCMDSSGFDAAVKSSANGSSTDPSSSELNNSLRPPKIKYGRKSDTELLTRANLSLDLPKRAASEPPPDTIEDNRCVGTRKSTCPL